MKTPLLLLALLLFLNVVVLTLWPWRRFFKLEEPDQAKDEDDDDGFTFCAKRRRIKW